MHRPGERTARRAAGLALLTALTTAAGCAVSSGDDPVDASAVNRLTRVLDLELAGREITTRSGFEALVAGAHPAVAAGLPGVFAPGNLEYAVYRGRGQALPQTSPVAVAVWYRATGGGVFVDDGGAWHVTCAQLSVDRSAATVRGSHVRCPGRVVGVPPALSADAPAPTMELDAPTDGELLSGPPAPTGVAFGAVLPQSRPTTTAACTADHLGGAVEALSPTVGSTDAGTIRVVNTGRLPCVLGGPVDLRLSQDGHDVPIRTVGGPAERVVLAPRESATAGVTWEPSQRADLTSPQRVALGPDLVPLRLGAGLPVVPFPVEPGATLRLTGWRMLGYGAPADDAPRRAGRGCALPRGGPRGDDAGGGGHEHVHPTSTLRRGRQHRDVRVPPRRRTPGWHLAGRPPGVAPGGGGGPAPRGPRPAAHGGRGTRPPRSAAGRRNVGPRPARWRAVMDRGRGKPPDRGPGVRCARGDLNPHALSDTGT